MSKTEAPTDYEPTYRLSQVKRIPRQQNGDLLEIHAASGAIGAAAQRVTVTRDLDWMIQTRFSSTSRDSPRVHIGPESVSRVTGRPITHGAKTAICLTARSRDTLSLPSMRRGSGGIGASEKGRQGREAWQWAVNALAAISFEPLGPSLILKTNPPSSLLIYFQNESTQNRDTVGPLP